MTESSDEKLLENLIKIQDGQKLEYTLHVGKESFLLHNAIIIKSKTPVNHPTYRGGVYFSDAYEYKIKGIINEPSIIPILSKTMLGPNTEFGEILIKTTMTNNSTKTEISLTGHLTNSMQSSSKVELNLLIVKAEKIQF